MLGRLFGRKPAEAADSRVPRQRLRKIEGSSAADRAAEMLTAPSALMQLSHDEARTVVAYMRPHKIPEGVRFGDSLDAVCTPGGHGRLTGERCDV